jgi:hypothetical protein
LLACRSRTAHATIAANEIRPENSAMSVQRTNFETAAAKGNWATAFANLNTLSMSEMLSSLSMLPKATLDNLIQRRFAFKSGLNMPRMEYAWTVVRSKQLPLVAPGDLLKNGQVQTAAQFIKKAAPSGPSKTLNLIVFSDSIVKNRTLFPELKKKAEEILAAQGNAFKLDVTVHPTDIAYQELMYLTTQLEEMVALAKKATVVPSERLIVLLVRLKPGLDTHGLATTVDGRRVVVIDTDTPNPDRATLLHEIGHCAGLPHAGDPPTGAAAPIDVGGNDNVMALSQANGVRDALTVTQGEFLSKAFFAK